MPSRSKAASKLQPHGAFTVTFPDFPEGITSGRNRTDAITQAEDCLQEGHRRPHRPGRNSPASRPRRGHVPVRVAFYLAPKLALYLAVREKRISNTALARRLGVSEMIVRRMLNPKHDTRPERLQQALDLLGKKLLISVEDAA